MTAMKISKRYKIEGATSCDETRTGLVNVRVTKRHAVASDGHILVVVPCEFEENDKEGWLTPAALKQAKKLDRKEDDATIGLDGEQVLSDGTKIPRPSYEDGDHFPKIGRIIREAKSQGGAGLRIGLDVNNLSRAADAIGTNKIILTFKGPEKAILVEPMDDWPEDRYAVVMPLRIP